MTRKHFQALADAIHYNVWADNDGNVSTEVLELVESIADACKRQNSGFKYDRFYTACGLDMQNGKAIKKT